MNWFIDHKFGTLLLDIGMPWFFCITKSRIMSPPLCLLNVLGRRRDTYYFGKIQYSIVSCWTEQRQADIHPCPHFTEQATFLLIVFHSGTLLS